MDSKYSNYLDDLDGIVINCVNRISRRSANSRLSYPTGSSNLIKFLNDDIGINRELCDTQNDCAQNKTLRRSLSTNEVDSPKNEHKRGKSLILLEENSDEEQDNFEKRKASNKKFSGLRKVEEFQKLASMYKKFQDEDLNVSGRPKSQIELANKNNLVDRLAYFEKKNLIDQDTSSFNFSREPKYRHSSFVFNKIDKNMVSSKIHKFGLLNNQQNYSEILQSKDEGFETQSNSSSSNTENVGNACFIVKTNSSIIREKEQLKRRSVCTIINRNKSEYKSLTESRHSIYSNKLEFKSNNNGSSFSIKDSQNTKFTSSSLSSTMYMNETVSTKAKKSNIKQAQKFPIQIQSKTKMVNSKNNENCTNLKNILTQSNKIIESDVDSIKARTISSSSSSTLGSHKLIRKNKIQNVLIKNKTLCKNDSIETIKF